ncbi:MAG TPA: hypothetical protein PKY77_18500 [Phycisphaerae bacterium]|nr:hypothetical protein [Phycisphaerae bacterium]HRY70900.1 hypothetical protein [Phycisphaerae bacterium]HSA29406.1 hypothetical protein [Phycisphaerae bacterium]
MYPPARAIEYGFVAFVTGCLVLGPAAWGQNEHCVSNRGYWNPDCGLYLFYGPPADQGNPPPLPEGCANLPWVCDASGTPGDDCLRAKPGENVHIKATWDPSTGACPCFPEIWVASLATRDRFQLAPAQFKPCNPPPSDTYEAYVQLPALNTDYKVTGQLIGPTETVDVGDPIRLTLRVDNPATWPVTVYLDRRGVGFDPEGIYLNDRRLQADYHPEVLASVKMITPDRIRIDGGQSGELAFECRVNWPGLQRFAVIPVIGDYISYFPVHPTPPLRILAYGVWIGEAKVNVEHEVRINKIEPVQVVYGERLVADKPTLVRVTFENRASQAQTKRVLTASPHPYGQEAFQTFAVDTIELPPGVSQRLLPVTGWLEPRLDGRFTVSVDPEVIDSWGPHEPEGKAPTTLKVCEILANIKPPKIRFARLSVIDFEHGFEMAAIPPSMLQEFRAKTVEYLNAVFPMPPIDVNHIQMPYLPTVGSLDRIFVQLEDAAVQAKVERIVGLLPNDLGPPFQSYYQKIGIPDRSGEANNVIGAAGRAAVVRPYDPLMQSDSAPVIVAHELGHTYGLPRTYYAREEYGSEGGPLEDGKPASPGVWVQGRDELGDDSLIQIGDGVNSAGQAVTNFMGRSGVFRRGSRIMKWTTNESYGFLLRRLIGWKVDPEVLLVSGIIGSDGSVQADPWYAFTSDDPSVSDPTGTHRVVFLDTSQQELGTFGFKPSFWRYQDPAPETSEATPASFALAVPAVAGFAEVQIRQGTNILYTRHVTPAAPGASIISPSAGETLWPGIIYAVRWSGSDADGDMLSYTALLSDDHGANWTTLAVNTQETTLAWEVPDIDASCAQLKIRASDGLRTAEAVSECFKIQGSSAAPLIARPGSSQTTSAGMAVQLDGSASLNSQGNQISFSWSVAGSPQMGDAQIEDDTTATPTFRAWTPGRYLVSLVISDGVRTSTPAYITITVSAVDPNHPNLVALAGAQLSTRGGTGEAGPVQVGDIVALAGGMQHSLALQSDGTVWAWGANPYGQLGDGTTTNSNVPVRVPGLTGVVAVAAGENHSLAVTSDGTVWAWGRNDAGQLGDGTTSDRAAPLQVAGLTGATAVAAGRGHSLALRFNGTAWGWGANSFGQLGDGSAQGRLLPIQVAGLSGVVSIAAGITHSLAVKSDGTAWTWGSNSNGQLGDGTQISRNTPVQVAELAHVAGIAGGEYHSLAFTTEGSLWSWGGNGNGELGVASWSAHLTPEHVSGLDSVSGVAAGLSHSLAVTSDGTVWAWGSDRFGQLGESVTTGQYAPVPVSGLAGVVRITAGQNHSLAASADGTAWTWGLDSEGQLGRGGTSSANTPVPLANLTSATRIAAGIDFSLALRSDGTVWGLGKNSEGQLGDGTTTDRGDPVQASGLSGVLEIAAGDSFSLARASDGQVWAWGDNTYGQLGGATGGSPLTPRPAPVLTGITAIAAGGYHGLALRSDGTVWAWGYNYSGQLGNGTRSSYSTPPGQVLDLTDVIMIAAGCVHSLAVKSDKTLWGWGYNSSGQLGEAASTYQLTPVQVSGLADVKAVAGGGSHTLALRSDGTLWAWGGNASGQLGDGTTAGRATPAQVPGLSDIVAVSAGYEHSLAIGGDGTVWTWGANWSGQLGSGAGMHQPTPMQVPGVRAVAVAGGFNHSLFLGLFSPPSVASVWPPDGQCEADPAAVLVSFDRPVVNVSADDLVPSSGIVDSVTGEGAGVYVFAISGVPPGPMTARLQGDITDLSGQQLPAYQWTFSRCLVLVPADLDRNGRVDLDDFEIFQACATGSDVPYVVAWPSGCGLEMDGYGRLAADLDADGDVDQSDFGIFQRCWSGANKPADPNCAN